jgi:lipoic acid synthetase
MIAKTKKPPWLRRRLPRGPEYEQTRRLIRQEQLHTVCQEAQCPNMFECFSHHTATFLILGDRCTRNCTFCAVQQGMMAPPDPAEPERVARAVAKLGLRYVVITSVTRDDLPDGGAGLYADTIRTVRKYSPEAKIEVLIPDFRGDPDALHAVLDAAPDILNHNLETVPRLYPAVRPQADYGRSLELLRRATQIAHRIPTKSGIMLGLGETEAEIRRTLGDLRAVGCRIVTIGQYLRPTAAHHAVIRFASPEEFAKWHGEALAMGFTEASCGPFVRSSYRAHDTFERMNVSSS